MRIKKYLPEDIEMEFIKRTYLLNINNFIKLQVLFVARREIYNKLYMDYKIIKHMRETVKWNGNYLNVNQVVSEGINQYNSVDK